MNSTFGYTLLIIGLLLAGWLGWQAFRRRPTNEPQIIAALLLELALVVLAVMAVIAVVQGAEPAEKVTFLAYLGGILLPLPLGIQLSRMERTRWGSIALCFTSVVVAVMMLRLLQLWNAAVPT